MALLDRLEGLAAKIESSYNTDPVVAEATDSIQTSDLEVNPLDGEFITRNLDGGALGERGDILVASRVVATFMAECAGAGAAGTAPEYGELLRACGFAETISALVDVVYDPVSSAFDSIWFEVNKAGTQHQAGGARGNLVINMAARQIPQMQFTLTGLYKAPTAVALPTYDLSNWQTPEAFNNENTITATLQGTTIELETFTVDMGNQIEHVDVVNVEEILLVDRGVRGTIQFQAPPIGTKDWFAVARAATVGALVVQHGDTAGNIYQINAPAVQLINPRYVESQGVLMISADLVFQTSVAAGNDEIKITVK